MYQYDYESGYQFNFVLINYIIIIFNFININFNAKIYLITNLKLS